MIKTYEVLADHWRGGVLVTRGEKFALDEAAARYDVLAKRLKESGGAGDVGPAASPGAANPEVFAAGAPKPASR